jgi:predicted benzoate:H+ symporter BenE
MGIVLIFGLALLKALPLSVFVGVPMLTIFLLEGYLVGRWKWTDWNKKYPE